MIETDDLVEGWSIPSERELCERYGVSRMTARQAVTELVNEGVLYREQGRGTFVAGRKVQQGAARLTSFTQDMRERGMKPSSVVLSVETVSAGPVLSRLLKVGDKERIVRLRRLRNADGNPMALEESHLLYEVTQGVSWEALWKGSLYQELDESGVKISRADQSYEAILVTDAEAEFLKVPTGSPALLIERLTFDAGDKPFEYVRSLYRADRYRITTALRP